MSAQPRHRAPGPPGHFLLGHLREFRSDVLGLLVEASRRYGDVVRFRLGPYAVHLLNHPDAVEHVLQKRAQNYDKQTRSARFIRTVCGESLLTSNGASWQSQRKALQPFFQPQSVRRFADVMTAAAARMLDDWQENAARRTPFDLASEMMKLTYRVAVKSLFAAEAGSDSEAIEDAMQVILPFTFGRLENVVNLPAWIPTPRNRRFHAALHSVDAVVHRLISEHRSGAGGRGAEHDLLGMLLAVRDAEGKPAFGDRQLRDQTITFLLAGHETTSNALTWTFYLLARHPDVQKALHDEIRHILQGRAPTVEELPRLQSVRHVLREAMRLYPPIWIIERRVVAEDSVRGFALPAGSAVVICPYTLHRHPAFWDEPDRFRPERFAKGIPAAYIPFGAGPRYCIGSEFAMLEAQLVTAMVAQRFRVSMVPGHVVQPWPGITLRTRMGVRVMVTDWG